MADVSSRLSETLDNLRARQLRAWQRGERLLVESLASGGTPPLRENELLELIFAEIMLRAECGEVCDSEEYLQRFPQFAAALKRLFSIHEAIEAPASALEETLLARKPDHRAKKTVPRSPDRNLLFGIMALQMDFITRDGLIDALRDWTTQKDKPLGEILVERGDLGAGRRDLLEPLVDEHVRQHGDDPAVSLAFVSSFVEASVEWHRVHDVNIAESLASRRLTRNAHALSTSGGSGGIAQKGGATRYRVLRPHAEGGLGCVLVAQDEELHREVALKEIKPQFARDLASRSRFTLEAEITGGLEHPGIVPVYGLGKYSDGRPYYAMRFIRGDSLKEAIEQFYATASPTSASVRMPPAKGEEPTFISGPETNIKEATAEPTGRKVLSREAFASVEFRKLLGRFIDVCQAIEYAHSRGVLHRDLKPGNIMLGKYGETLVVDWGLAKAAGKDDRFANVDEATLVPSSGSSIENTADGSVIGTPAYMSPEQAAGRLEQLGPATDVYSLGATLYHLLTGRSPFSKQPLPDLLKKVQGGEFCHPRESSPHIPKALEAICLKAMAASPHQRYESAAALADDIENWLADNPVNAFRETVLAQASRWLRKHRAWAMSGAASLGIVAVVATLAAVWINSARNKVVNAQNAEARQLKIALSKESEARRHLYAANLNLAQGHWEAAHIDLVRDILQKTTPQPGENDLRGLEWHYWQRQCDWSQLQFSCPDESIMAVSFLPNGRTLMSIGHEGTVQVWDAVTGHRKRSLKFHVTLPSHVTTSADGRRIAAVTEDQTIKVLEMATGIDTFIISGHTGPVNGLSFSANGEWLASAGNDQTLKVWNMSSGRESISIKGHDYPISTVLMSPDGSRVVSSCPGDGTLKIWDAATGQQMLSILGLAEMLAFSPDGSMLAVAGFSDIIEIWDANRGQKLSTLDGHSVFPSCFAFSSDGKRLATSSDDRTVKVWDLNTGHEEFTLRGHADRVSSVAFSSDGKRLVSGGNSGTLIVWDAVNGQKPLKLSADSESLSCVAFSPNGQHVLSAGSNGFLSAWQVASGQEVLSTKLEQGFFQCISISPSGKWLALGDTDPEDLSKDRDIKIVDVEKGTIIRRLKGHSTGVKTLAFCPDGQRLASGAFDPLHPDKYHHVKIWDVTSGQEIIALSGHSGSINCVAFDSNGGRLASAGSDATVRIWDSVSGKEMFLLRGHISSVNCVAFSKNGEFVASAGDDQTVRVWDATTGQEKVTLSGHAFPINCVTFSLDGRRIVTGGWGGYSTGDPGQLKVWDVMSGQQLLTLDGHVGPIEGLAFSPDGNLLASVDGSGVQIWDFREWTTELRIEREAVSVINFLSRQRRPKTEWQSDIENDKTISEAVRARALQFTNH